MLWSLCMLLSVRSLRPKNSASGTYSSMLIRSEGFWSIGSNEADPFTRRPTGP